MARIFPGIGSALDGIDPVEAAAWALHAGAVAVFKMVVVVLRAVVIAGAGFVHDARGYGFSLRVRHDREWRGQGVIHRFSQCDGFGVLDSPRMNSTSTTSPLLIPFQ